MKLIKALGALGASLILPVILAPAHATSTDVVLNLEGNPTCSSLGDNSAVLEFRDSSPDSTPDSPKFATLNIVDSMGNPAGNQVVEYTVSSANPPTLSWAITSVNNFSDQDPEFFQQVNPINYIILKAQGGVNGARVFHFGAAGPGSGAIADEDEEATGSNLAAVSFCYGLTTGFIPPEPPIGIADLPACQDLTPPGGTAGDLFTTGIICPDPIIDPDTGLPINEQLIINMALNDPRFGFDVTTDTIRACTCNSELKACNPALPAQRVDSNGNYVNDLGQFVDQNGMVIPEPITADDLSQEDRTCLEYNPDSTNDRGTPDGVNDRTPFVIMGVENPDTYICYTIDGVRTCYGHF